VKVERDLVFFSLRVVVFFIRSVFLLPRGLLVLSFGKKRIERKKVHPNRDSKKEKYIKKKMKVVLLFVSFAFFCAFFFVSIRCYEV